MIFFFRFFIASDARHSTCKKEYNLADLHSHFSQGVFLIYLRRRFCFSHEIFIRSGSVRVSQSMVNHITYVYQPHSDCKSMHWRNRIIGYVRLTNEWFFMCGAYCLSEGGHDHDSHGLHLRSEQRMGKEGITRTILKRAAQPKSAVENIFSIYFSCETAPETRIYLYDSHTRTHLYHCVRFGFDVLCWESEIEK